jgi:serine beta-lactamase-like protein LACTB
MRNDKKRLVNVPSVDNSYKWAGGGILSNVTDLIKFGNKMLYFYQSNSDDGTNFLQAKTLKNLVWAHQSNPFDDPKDKQPLSEPNEVISYGLGWKVCFDRNTKNIKYVYHTGGAMGAVSCLLIIPDNELKIESIEALKQKETSGIVVAVLCNSHDVSNIVKFTLKVADYFK